MTTEVRSARADDAAGIRAVMEACLATDGIPGFGRSDIERALVRIVPDPEGTVVALDDGRIAGYATPHHDDLTVHPAARRRGHGRRLVGAALELTRRRGGDVLQLYVPPHLPASVAFAEALGFTYRSSLWQFELARRSGGRPAVRSHQTSSLAAFDDEREADADDWVTFMLACFEGHPTRMSWTPAVIAHVNASPDFDPSGILIVSPADAPDRRIAFARIETHVGEGGAVDRRCRPHRRAPRMPRRGLGRELLRWGIADLRRARRGADRAVRGGDERPRDGAVPGPRLRADHRVAALGPADLAAEADRRGDGDGR